MPKLSLQDFDYYKSMVDKDKTEHNKMLKKHIPENILDAYEGRICERNGSEFEVVGNMVENYLFISANTIIPTLFYQVPRPIIRGMREELKYSAAVISGLVKVYARDDFKKEIQACIIDAFLPYPFACMKVGYNSRTGKYSPTPSLLTGKTEGGNDKSMEASQEYLKFEKPFIERQSPRYTYLDSTKPFGKDRRITFEYDRTLQELLDSNLYGLSEDFIRYHKARNENDARKCTIKIMEHWCMKDGYAYKLVYTPDWHDELAWGKTPYKSLPRELLCFNELGDRLYTTSHGYLAYEAQKELNYQNEIRKEHIDKVRRQHLVYAKGLTPEGRKVLEANIIDGIAYTEQPLTAGVYQQISSNAMGQDVYAGIENIRQYLKLILSASGGKGGETESKFAYTEKQQAIGDYMRTSGLQGAVRDFARNIIKKMVSHIVAFGDPEITIQITGKNVIDPITGEMITGKEMQIGGAMGLKLQEEIKGDVETDYIYDVDIMSAQRPDFPVVRAQLKEFIELMAVLEPKLAMEGKKVEYAELAKDMANTFETLVDPEKYLSDMTDEDKALLQQKMMMAALPPGKSTGAPGPVKPPPIQVVPTEPNAGAMV